MSFMDCVKSDDCYIMKFHPSNHEVQVTSEAEIDEAFMNLD